MNAPSIKTTKLFDIVAPYNSLCGTFTKSERLTVNIARQNFTGAHNGFIYRVIVTNAAGKEVNRILKWSLTRKTAVGWAKGNFGHSRVA